MKNNVVQFKPPRPQEEPNRLELTKLDNGKVGCNLFRYGELSERFIVDENKLCRFMADGRLNEAVLQDESGDWVKRKPEPLILESPPFAEDDHEGLVNWLEGEIERRGIGKDD